MRKIRQAYAVTANFYQWLSVKFTIDLLHHN